MKKNRWLRYFIFFFPILILIKIFSPWFVNFQINAGDWPYYGGTMLKDFTIFAPLWSSKELGGLGGVNINFPLFGYQHFTIAIANITGVPWDFVYKFFWFVLPLVFGSLAIKFLYKIVKSDASPEELSFSMILYLVNSYFLMIAGGGQMGIVLAYSVAPFVIGQIIQSVQIMKLRAWIIWGLVLSLQVFFDLRIALITFSIGISYLVYANFFISKIKLLKLIKYVLASLLLVLLLHSYWLIPFYLFKLFLVPEGITASSGFAFFSFANFSNVFSFLHPNWPENIFGKVYFLKPEFLIYPIFAYSFLLFSNRTFSKRSVKLFLFFALLGIFGAFLGKGVNEPFGIVNVLLFKYVPGFNLFRDPTKFYLFIALSYSLLIPFSADIISQKILRFRFMIFIIFYIIIFYSVRATFLGELQGTFTYNPIPIEYKTLDNFLSRQPEFFRTLWIPDQSRFRFTSEKHPMTLSANILKSKDLNKIHKQLLEPNVRQYMRILGIKYIILPYDSTSEIFLTDRKYDAKKREKFENMLDSLLGIKKISLGKIVLYELTDFYDRFRLSNENVSYTKASSSYYKLSVNLKTNNTLFFSETFHPGWVVSIGNKEIPSVKTNEGFNSFKIPNGKYNLTVIFKPQNYQGIFYFISIASLVSTGVYLILSIKEERITSK